MAPIDGPTPSTAARTAGMADAAAVLVDAGRQRGREQQGPAVGADELGGRLVRVVGGQGTGEPGRGTTEGRPAGPRAGQLAVGVGQVGRGDRVPFGSRAPVTEENWSDRRSPRWRR